MCIPCHLGRPEDRRTIITTSTSDYSRAFIVYLLSHNRPTAEILAPTQKILTEDGSSTATGQAWFSIPIQPEAAGRSDPLATRLRTRLCPSGGWASSSRCSPIHICSSWPNAPCSQRSARSIRYAPVLIVSPSGD